MIHRAKDRGYCLEMICADFLAGASIDGGNAEILLQCSSNQGLTLKGLNTWTFSCLKSSSFLVATIRSCLRAVAAIIPSSTRSSDLPCISRPHSRNEAVSIGRIWYEASS